MNEALAIVQQFIAEDPGYIALPGDPATAQGVGWTPVHLEVPKDADTEAGHGTLLASLFPTTDHDSKVDAILGTVADAKSEVAAGTEGSPGPFRHPLDPLSFQ